MLVQNLLAKSDSFRDLPCDTKLNQVKSIERWYGSSSKLLSKLESKHFLHKLNFVGFGHCDVLVIFEFRIKLAY